LRREAVSSPAGALGRAAACLAANRPALLESWRAASLALRAGSPAEVAAVCSTGLEAILDAVLRGGGDQAGASSEAASGSGATPRRLHAELIAARVFAGCCLPFLAASDLDREALAEALVSLQQLAWKRVEGFLNDEAEESARRLAEAENQGARSAERVDEVSREIEGVRRSESRSQHRAEQLALLNWVVHRMAGILDPERLMQEAASTIQGRMKHNYVAVVALEADGAVVGRWAGRPGVARESAGRRRGEPRGIIGRALRKRAPQVVPDVSRDADYHADVPGTRSEMVVPLLEAGEAVGALDFQSEQLSAFDLDDVVAAEVLGEFLIVALRNARRFIEQGGAASS